MIEMVSTETLRTTLAVLERSALRPLFLGSILKIEAELLRRSLEDDDVEDEDTSRS